MRFPRRAAVVLTCMLMAGCSHFAGRRPLLGYTEKGVPHSDTAIVACAEQTLYVCGITGVNQVATWDKFNGGKTQWVRVLPGKQLIKMTLSNSRLLTRQNVVIDNVQAGHVYRIDVGYNGTLLTATATDLGKLDSYTIHMPRFPLKPKAITATF